MGVVLDHTIIPVREPAEAARFYAEILGLEDEGQTGPFAVVRVNESTTLDFTEGDPGRGRHYAFAMTPEEFDAAFARIRAAGVAYGDGPFTAKNMQGPGETPGARGMGRAVYFYDPCGHLLEIKSY